MASNSWCKLFIFIVFAPTIFGVIRNNEVEHTTVSTGKLLMLGAGGAGIRNLENEDGKAKISTDKHMLLGAGGAGIRNFENEEEHAQVGTSTYPMLGTGGAGIRDFENEEEHSKVGTSTHLMLGAGGAGIRNFENEEENAKVGTSTYPMLGTGGAGIRDFENEEEHSKVGTSTHLMLGAGGAGIRNFENEEENAKVGTSTYPMLGTGGAGIRDFENEEEHSKVGTSTHLMLGAGGAGIRNFENEEENAKVGTSTYPILGAGGAGIRNFENEEEHNKVITGKHLLLGGGGSVNRNIDKETISSGVNGGPRLLGEDTLEMGEEEKLSTEKFIQKRWDVSINMTKLMEEYALVCPLRDTCGIDLRKDLVYSGQSSDAFSDCTHCSCSRDCLNSGRCCPGSHYGYVKHECVNLVLYPREERESLNFNMVTTCLQSFNENQTIVEMCKTTFHPCTSSLTDISYSNMFCAMCNKDNSCVPWEKNVECVDQALFETKIKSVSSFAEMRRALNASECRIRFYPNGGLDSKKSYCKTTEKKTHLINTCNVTGFWMEHDLDILWACEHFWSPYKDFQNVFCYICNPSVATRQSVALVVTCGQSSKSFGQAIEQACKNFPVSTRLKPFKNIYCYACNRMRNQSTFRESIRIVTVSGTQTYVNVKSAITVAMPFSGTDLLNNLESFLRGLLWDDIRNVHSNMRHHNSNKNTSNTLDKLERYTDVCGTGANVLCYQNTSLRVLSNELINITLSNIGLASTSTYQGYANPVCGKCSCNNTCAEHMNCCWDLVLTKKPYSCVDEDYFPSLHNSKAVHNQSNVSDDSGDIKTAYSYTLIDACYGDSTAKELENNCTTASDSAIFNIPLTTKDTKGVYRNIYCYLCNNNNSNVTLNIQMRCNKFIEPNLYINMTLLQKVIKLHCTHITFIPAQSSYCKRAKYDVSKAASLKGIGYSRNDSSEDSVSEVIFIPKNKYGLYSEYKRKVFERCNKTGMWHADDAVTREICETVSIDTMFLSEYRVDKTVYRNFACFLCNPDQDSYENNIQPVSDCTGNKTANFTEHRHAMEDLCRNSSLQTRWRPYKNMYCAECNLPKWIKITTHVSYMLESGVSSYRYMFSLSPEDFNQVQHIEEIPDCPNGTYDHILRECRRVYCPDKTILRNNTCRYFMNSAWDHNYFFKVALRPSHVNKNWTENDNTSRIVNLENLCESIRNRVISILHNATTDLLVFKVICESLESCLDVGTNNAKVTFSGRDELFLDAGITVHYAEDIMFVREALLQAITATYYIEGVSGIIALKASFPFKEIDVPVDSCRYGYQFFSTESKNIANVKYEVDDFLICPFVKFNRNDVLIDAQTLTIYVKSLNLSFKQSKYKDIKGIGFAVCEDDFRRMFDGGPTSLVMQPPHPLVNPLNLFTTVCTILSLISLSLTFITYSLFPDLRTIPGKINMIMCVFLSVAQSLLQFGLKSKAHDALCIAVGIGNHFFWIGTFCVMNVSSFHMFNIFYLNQLSHMNTSKNLFVKYFSYSIAVPSVFVLAVIAKALMESNGTVTGYGKQYCFISDFYMFICTFVTPAGLIFLSNMVFFALAFYKIHSSPRVQSTRNRHEFILYIKLCTLVGVTWPLLILDNIIGISWFSFIVSGVNALQGVFIFYSYIINKRVASMFKSLVSGTTVEQAKTQPESRNTCMTRS